MTIIIGPQCVKTRSTVNVMKHDMEGYYVAQELFELEDGDKVIAKNVHQAPTAFGHPLFKRQEHCLEFS